MTDDIEDRTRWPGQHAWLLKNLEGMQRVFAPRIRAFGSEEVAVTDA
jgi:hypothetical protein